MRWLGGFVLLGIGLIVLLGQLALPIDPRRSVREELVAPYAEAVRSGLIAEAYADFTTEGYRSETSVLLYITGMHRNDEEWGPLQELVLLPDEPERVHEPGHPELLRVTVQRIGERMKTTARFDLVQVDDEWRIERTWWWPEQGPAVERVF